MKKRTGFLIVAICLIMTLLSIPSFAEEACHHIWSAWSIDYEPTCSDEGAESRYCLSCYETETRTIKPTGKHDWGEWEITKSPTITRRGNKVRYCWECDTPQYAKTQLAKPYAKLNKKKVSLTVGKSYQLKVKKAAGDKVRKWKSSNKNIASVSSKGKVQARKAGTAKITVILKSGKRAVCKVIVKNPPVRRAAAPAKTPSASTPSAGGGTVYWTPGGEVYHSTPNCPSLARSRIINSGSLANCPKGRACKNCH